MKFRVVICYDNGKKLKKPMQVIGNLDVSYDGTNSPVLGGYRMASQKHEAHLFNELNLVANMTILTWGIHAEFIYLQGFEYGFSGKRMVMFPQEWACFPCEDAKKS